MKRIILSLGILAIGLASQAQDKNNNCVAIALENYSQGGAREDIEGAMKCSDEASVNDATSGKGKTWFYRGQLYTKIFRDSVLRSKYANAGLEAVKAFKKLYDLNDPKIKGGDWDDATNSMYVLGQLVFNEAVDYYQHRNYTMAFQYFHSIKDLNEVLVGKKKEPNIDLGKALRYAAQSAESSGDKESALKVYKEWVDAAPSAVGYQRYGLSLKTSGDTIQAKKVIDEGLVKYPKDPMLLVEKINFYLEAGQYTEALQFVNNLLDVEPKNDGALFIKALAYDKLGKEDSVIYYYNKAIEVNPKGANAYINLAAVYVNKAKTVSDERNKLGNSSADTKKYEEMTVQIKQLYVTAKPFLEKAKELLPGDTQVTRTLYQINSFLESNSK